MNSILPFLKAVVATKPDHSSCGLFDFGARLSLEVEGYLLVATGDDGAIYGPLMPYPAGLPAGPVVIPLRLPSAYRLAPSTMQCSPFTNLQRLLVMIPEATL